MFTPGSKSSEFALVVLIVVGAFVSVWTGDMTAEQVIDVLKWVAPFYIGGRSLVKFSGRGDR